MSSVSRRTALMQMSALAGAAVLAEGLGAEGLPIGQAAAPLCRATHRAVHAAPVALCV